jgi:hypothetical protein
MQNYFKIKNGEPMSIERLDNPRGGGIMKQKRREHADEIIK